MANNQKIVIKFPSNRSYLILGIIFLVVICFVVSITFIYEKDKNSDKGLPPGHEIINIEIVIDEHTKSKHKQSHHGGDLTTHPEFKEGKIVMVNGAPTLQNIEDLFKFSSYYSPAKYIDNNNEVNYGFIQAYKNNNNDITGVRPSSYISPFEKLIDINNPGTPLSLERQPNGSFRIKFLISGVVGPSSLRMYLGWYNNKLSAISYNDIRMSPNNYYFRFSSDGLLQDFQGNLINIGDTGNYSLSRVRGKNDICFKIVYVETNVAEDAALKLLFVDKNLNKDNDKALFHIRDIGVTTYGAFPPPRPTISGTFLDNVNSTLITKLKDRNLFLNNNDNIAGGLTGTDRENLFRHGLLAKIADSGNEPANNTTYGSYNGFGQDLNRIKFGVQTDNISNLSNAHLDINPMWSPLDVTASQVPYYSVILVLADSDTPELESVTVRDCNNIKGSQTIVLFGSPHPYLGRSYPLYLDNKNPLLRMGTVPVSDKGILGYENNALVYAQWFFPYGDYNLNSIAIFDLCIDDNTKVSNSVSCKYTNGMGWNLKHSTNSSIHNANGCIAINYSGYDGDTGLSRTSYENFYSWNNTSKTYIRKQYDGVAWVNV